ncbi:MAG: protein kinase domain-containing protein, partial [Micrococcales bacterium]
MANLDLSGRVLNGRYRIERLIARGGMASVFLAIDERLEREVAIKVIYEHLAEDDNFKAKFLREAKIAAKLSHPNIVNIFDQGEEAELIYLAMEYVPSITLRDALKRFGAIPPRRALELFELILQGLAAAHQKNILHRDIKPENVFLADDGRIKLGDFGLAREADSHTSTGTLVGTIAYLSPELITRGKADARSDVYAAGIMLFEMLTGEQPYQGSEVAHIAHQHTAAQMPLPSSKNSKVPALVDELVLWATAREPRYRPKDASELLEVTQRVLSELKNGRADTVKLEVLETAKTRIYSAEELSSFEPDAAATQDLNDLGLLENPTQRLEVSAVSNDNSALSNFARRRRTSAKFLTLTIPVFAILAGLAGFLVNGGINTIPDLKNNSVETAL